MFDNPCDITEGSLIKIDQQAYWKWQSYMKLCLNNNDVDVSVDDGSGPKVCVYAKYDTRTQNNIFMLDA